MKTHFAFIIIAGIIISSASFAQNTRVEWSVFDMGYAVPASSTTRVHSVAGQMIIGSSEAGNTRLNSGFLVHPVLDDPLPIQLASFTATIIQQRHVRLDWRTLSEVNNYGFYVQRKQGSDSVFFEIPNSFVPGHGTTNEPHDYSYVDTTATPGQLSYRLKQIDLDGSIHYSDPITVELTTTVEEPQVPKVFSLLQNYPNPFNPTTTIWYEIPSQGRVELAVCNTLGQTVATLLNEELNPGSYKTTWDAAGFASGVYFYRLQSRDGVQTRKLVLVR